LQKTFLQPVASFAAGILRPAQRMSTSDFTEEEGALQNWMMNARIHSPQLLR
jgi:hypothetical protein